MPTFAAPRFLLPLLLAFFAPWAHPQDVPVVSLQSGHVSSAGDLAVSANGRLLFSVDSRAILVWDVPSRRMLRRLDMPAGVLPDGIAVTPDGSTLALTRYGGAPAFVSVADGTTRLAERAGFDRTGYSGLAISPDGSLLATADSSSHVLVWDVATARLQKSFRASSLPLSAVAWSPDGRQLAVGTQLTVVIIDAADGERRGRLEGVNTTALDWRRDGSIAVGTRDGTIHLWRPGDAAAFTRWRATTAEHGVQRLQSLPDGTLLSTDFDAARTWTVPEGTELKRFSARAVAKARAAPDGSEIFASSVPNVQAFALATGEERDGFLSRGSELYGADFASDGARVATLGTDQRLTVWDIPNGRALLSDRSPGGLGRAQFDGDALRVVRTTDDDQASTTLHEEWDAEDKRKLGSFTTAQTHEERVSRDFSRLLWIPQRVVGGEPGEVVHMLDVAQRRELGQLRLPTYTNCLAPAPKGGLAAICIGTEVKLWDPVSGSVRTLAGHGGEARAAALSDDGRLVVTGDAKGAVRVWDVATATQQTQFAVPGAVNGISLSSDGRWIAVMGDYTGAQVLPLAGGSPRSFGGPELLEAGFSPDGRLVYTVGGDKSLRLWRLQDGFELGRFIPIGTDDWVVITPEGYFNASSFAAADAVNVNFHGAVYGASEFWDVFYRPDLVRKRLAGQDLRAGTGGLTFAQALQSPPPRDVKVSLSGTPALDKSAKARVRFAVPDAGGGIGEVRVFHNGKLVTSGKPGAGNRSICARRGSTCEGELDIESIPGQENDVSVMAFNGSNTMQGLVSHARFTSTLPTRPPRLWVVAVGINQFAPAQKAFGNLTNAAKDARDFLAAYVERARGLFAPEDIHVVGAAGSPVLADEHATRAAILAALDSVAAQARPEDTFVWFVASHGTTNADGVFGVVPHDVRCQGPACDPANLVDATDILDRTKSIRAMTQVLILDTCQSGALDGNIAGFYDARMAVLARQLGLHLYASAQATEHAADSDGSGNGLFTGQLLRGLRSPTVDTNHDGMVSIVELGDYAQKRTVAATGGVGSRGATVAGAATGPRPRKAIQTPLMMHFGRDRDLARAVTP